GTCRTAHCIAGGAAVMTGHKPVYTSVESNHGEEAADAVTCVKGEWRPGEIGSVFVRDPGAEEATIPNVAQAELGLSGAEACVMFKSSNTIGDLKGLVNVFARRRGLDDPYPGYRP